MQLGGFAKVLADAADGYFGKMRVPIFAEKLCWHLYTQLFAVERMESGRFKPGIVRTVPNIVLNILETARPK